MSLAELFDPSVLVTSPPPGTVNVQTGTAIEGPGGRWVPCASAVPDGTYVPCVYEVGPGRRQVCNTSQPTPFVDEALSRAITLATTAAA
ncbi:hypothetical protein CEP88_18365 [Roseobacter denitrificans]|uniref:Uncharacterized protein n=1 Tax=Roseobacter denitrificans (strain ATCC 33942 / OCh 114) TaxID=375451 RepID=Q169L0_ROSDO|nr:hypothetical protein [Roseobacter denitrificans]ABG31333.1 conserved hypothetical protein [Roseobacter denitrificans OCh 114]AVL54364.1 hypothetical protein CEP88_18365 [Roseobacter denitrificans]SFF99653.1 hypothetical protein SAMN05443635_105155 [Roseobacter denitrificans OCh 114]